MLEILGGAVSITEISCFIFIVAVIMMLGYALGRITIKGVCLGTAGVFLVASAYAATYPIALIAVVFASQLLIFLL